MHYDVFNGDADGIIALVQLRLAQPKQAKPITGVKRDIKLLKQVPKDAHSVTVLDISMETNKEALVRLLENGVKVFYVDHHRSGDIPDNSLLKAIVDTDANTCTSLLVNHYLNGRFAHWAVAAAYGDNMLASAEKLAQQLELSDTEKAQLKALGIYINYNGYGRTVDDLHIAPAKLFELLVNYENPLDLIAEQDSVFYQLERAYQSDMQQADNAKVLVDNDVCKMVQLPDEKWARRVSGVFGNELANRAPKKAHAVFTVNEDGSYTVSLRAPLVNKQGAGDICVQFPTGGGREAAAGINQLPAQMIEQFIKSVSQYYS